MTEICGKVYNAGRPDEVTCHRPRGHDDGRGCSGVALEGDEVGAHGKHLTHVPDYMRKPPRERGRFTVRIEYADGTHDLVEETQCDKAATALRRAITAKDYRRDITAAIIVPEPERIPFAFENSGPDF